MFRVLFHGTRASARWIGAYWRHARRPLASIALVAPLVLFYEAAIYAWGPDAVSRGVDAVLRGILGRVGFGHWILLPLATVFILLAWYLAARRRMRTAAALLTGMIAESGAWSLALVALAAALGVWTSCSVAALAIGASGETSPIARAASLAGAGVYEEIVFRLTLLPLLYFLLRRATASMLVARAWSVILACALFVVAHHVAPGAPPLCWSALVFRFAAGVILSLLFYWRGLGIAVGTHVAYDMLVGLR